MSLSNITEKTYQRIFMNFFKIIRTWYMEQFVIVGTRLLHTWIDCFTLLRLDAADVCVL